MAKKTTEDTSRDWRHGSNAGRNDGPTQSAHTSGRPRNAADARQPIHTSKKPGK